MGKPPLLLNALLEMVMAGASVKYEEIEDYTSPALTFGCINISSLSIS